MVRISGYRVLPYLPQLPTKYPCLNDALMSHLFRTIHVLTCNISILIPMSFTIALSSEAGASAAVIKSADT